MQSTTWLGNMDLARIAIWAFWLFFAGLVLWLHRENKREGYPLVSDRSDKVFVEGFPAMPAPKFFVLPHGGTAVNPKPPVHAPYLAAPLARFPGAPLVPIGDPMLSRAGPGAYALRHDGPDLMFEDSTPKIVPLRTLPEFGVSPGDPDPRGWEVTGADGIVAGTAVDLWLDKADMLFRFLEVEVPTAEGARRIMIPTALIRVDEERRKVRVKSLLSKHFAIAPTLRDADTITVTEEDMVQAFCSAGQLYATPDRAGPLL